MGVFKVYCSPFLNFKGKKTFETSITFSVLIEWAKIETDEWMNQIVLNEFETLKQMQKFTDELIPWQKNFNNCFINTILTKVHVSNGRALFVAYV